MKQYEGLHSTNKIYSYNEKRENVSTIIDYILSKSIHEDVNRYNLKVHTLIILWLF